MDVGIVGCGTMASIHAEAYRAADARIVGIAGGNRERGTALARAHGTSWFGDLAAMVERRRPSAVSVTTPNERHRRVAVQALERGIAVLCEKTQAATESESRALLDDVRRLGTPFQIGYMKRFHPVVQCFVEWARELGPIDSGHVTCHQGMASWPDDLRSLPARHGGGILLHGGSHVIDLLVWTLGSVPSHVTAATRTLAGCQVEHLASGLLEFPGGTPVTIETSWLPLTGGGPLGTGWDETLTLRSPEGIVRLVLVNWRRSGTMRPIVSLYRRSTNQTLRFSPTPVDWFAAEISAFLRAVRERRPCSPDAVDGYRVDLTIHSCYRSARSGRRLQVPDPTAS